MSLVFLCLAPVFTPAKGVRRALSWLFVASFAVSVIALVLVTMVRGIDRADVFEIIVISVVWLTLIAAGPLLAVILRGEGSPRSFAGD